MVSASLIDECVVSGMALRRQMRAGTPVMDELGWGRLLDSCKEQRAQGSRVHCGWQQSPTATRE